MKAVEWLLKLLRRERHDIGRKGLPDYLTRWTLWGKRFGDKPRHNVFLHCFHRGDAEPYCHDHPWPFWSLILWGGYWEITPCIGIVNQARAAVRGLLYHADGRAADDANPPTVAGMVERRWYGPLSLLRRPAEWRHRVELPKGRKCWTLIWCGPKERSWGFWCPGKGFINWRQHQASQDAGGAGCE
jgi:hypothetical protein